MSAPTHPEFDAKTEGLEVAKAFPDSIRGKTILVTGVNRGGIGFTTVQAFASQSPAHLIIASRTPSKIQECIDALKSDYPKVDYRALELNLSTQKGVRASAAELLSWSDIPTIDIAVNNAAVMNIPERTINEDGIEIHFATNHIGHFLFTNLIMPRFIKAAETSPKGATRVINVSSGSPTVATMRWSDMNFETINKNLPEEERPNYQMHQYFGSLDSENKAYVPIEGYNQSKVANLLFSIGLNKRVYEKYGILSFAIHPGVIQTELSRSASEETMAAVKKLLSSGMFPVKSLGGGAATSILVAVDPKLGLPVSKTEDGKENYGAFFSDCQIDGKATPRATSSAEAEKLWARSEELVKEKFAL